MSHSPGKETMLDLEKPSSKSYSLVFLQNLCCKAEENQREYYKEAALKWVETSLGNWMIG